MRAKKILLLTVLIVSFVIVFIITNSFLVPTLRCHRARQFPVSEYDRSEYDHIVMAAYPSFHISIFDLIDVSCDEKGYLYLEYIRNREHTLPMSPDVFNGLDGDYDYLYIFRYDPLWNHLECISRDIKCMKKHDDAKELIFGKTTFHDYLMMHPDAMAVYTSYGYQAFHTSSEGEKTSVRFKLSGRGLYLRKIESNN